MLDYTTAKRLRDLLWKWESLFDDNPGMFGSFPISHLLCDVYNEILAEREWLDEMIELHEIDLGMREDQPN